MAVFGERLVVEVSRMLNERPAVRRFGILLNRPLREIWLC
jgi:hypothetical protein